MVNIVHLSPDHAMVPRVATYQLLAASRRGGLGLGFGQHAPDSGSNIQSRQLHHLVTIYYAYTSPLVLEFNIPDSACTETKRYRQELVT